MIALTLSPHKNIFRPVCPLAGGDCTTYETWWRPGDRGRKPAVKTATVGSRPHSSAYPSPIDAGSIAIRLLVAVSQHGCIVQAAIILKPSTLLRFHAALWLPQASSPTDPGSDSGSEPSGKGRKVRKAQSGHLCVQ